MQPAQHPFFDPLWRRIAVIVVVVVWAGVELFYTREPLWIALSLAMVAYGVWTFLIKWPKPPSLS